jgi:hypothetical protein
VFAYNRAGEWELSVHPIRSRNGEL